MIYGEEEQIQELKNKVEAYRAAAAAIPKIKKVVREYNGKIYNKKLDEAIRALSDENHYFYISNSYGWIYFYTSMKRGYTRNIALLSGYSCKAENEIPEERQTEENKVFDGKRINAEKMIKMLDQRYSDLLKKAFELEIAIEHLDEYKRRIEDIKTLYSAVIHVIPSEIIDVCGFKRYI